MIIRPSNPLNSLALLLLLFIYSSFLFHKINLVTADLGRHIRNGEVFFQTFKPLSTNFYSYTNPDFPVPNHHWASGVIYYILWKISGFSGLQIFFIALSLATFLIFFILAKDMVGTAPAALISLLIIPLLAERTEIRPEVFSYLFAGIFLYLLWKFSEEKLSFKKLFILPVVEAFWVNLHIFFFLGPALVLVFLIESLLTKSKNVSRLASIFFITSLATLANPFGLKGALAPFSIFENYGYRIIENQPVWFIEKLISDPNFLIFKIVFGFLIVTFIFHVLYAKTKFKVSLFLILCGVSILAWFQIRNFTLFGLFSLVGISYFLKHAVGSFKARLDKVSIALLSIATIIILSGNVNRHFPYWREAGLGLETGNQNAAEFIRKNNIAGPILNNYDIGGYLIFNLYPDARVFVDNRPEAYPASFFQETYIPALESEDIWKNEEEKYKFNAIVFSVTDATPWAQKFLVNRVRDKNWAVVYLDKYIIILLNQNAQNKEIINKYEALYHSAPF